MSDRITCVLADAIAAGEIDGGGMPNRFVLVATTLDADGAERVAFAVNDGAHTMETLGLLDGAQAVYRAAFADWVRGDE